MRRFTGVAPFSLDLHVLSAPLTFVLSQDQTLQLNPVCSGPAKEPAALTLECYSTPVKEKSAWSSREVGGVGPMPAEADSVTRPFCCLEDS